MKTLIHTTIALAAVIGLSTPVLAGEGAAKGERGDRAQKMQQRLKAADKDGDGKISKAEADQSLPRIAKQFADIDTDKDGFVTRAEMRAWHQKNGGPRKGQS
ncbi:MAG: EF-hand domain-containing protein [Betaproteobacteria bacterium]|nr:EF-hand domain-containing protein [Betaproteobacteria bacterium]